MKNIFKVMGIALILWGCSADTLDRAPLGDTEESFFDEPVDYFTLSLTAYSELTDFYWWHGGSGNYLHGLWHMSGDDITSDNQFQDMELFTASISPTNGKIGEFWDRAYVLIGKANVMIDKTTTADRDAFEDTSFLDHIAGEGYFLRGYMFWKLYNKFGTAPLITERITTFDKIDNPKTEGVQLLDQAISDLEAAANLLPESWEASNKGRVFANSARGMLVKALVFRGNYGGGNADYTQALTVFNTINNSVTSLTPAYTDNFDVFDENNEESLFEFQASTATGLDNVWLDNGGPWRGVESMHAFWGFFDASGSTADNDSGGNPWRITQKLSNAYGIDAGTPDPRLEFFMEADRSFTKYGKAGFDQLNGTGRGSRNNPRILRYSDVILMAAEAAARTNDLTTAVDLINDVRTRARDWAATVGAPDITTTGEPADRPASTDQAEVLDWVFDERWVELAGEEDARWFDLKRMHETGLVDLATWAADDNGWSTDLASPTQFNPNKLIWPIPQVEIDRNNAISTNNPGY